MNSLSAAMSSHPFFFAYIIDGDRIALAFVNYAVGNQCLDSIILVG